MGRLGPRRDAVLTIAGLAAAGVVAVLALTNPLSGRGSQRLLRPDDARLVALGQKVYTAHCAACHGQGLEGPPNWHHRGADGRLPAPPHDSCCFESRSTASRRQLT